MFDWSDITRRFKDLRALIDTKPVTRWGVITNTDPLLVQLDGDDRPIAGSPSTIIGGLAAGERVLCLVQNRRVTVLGRGGSDASNYVQFGAHKVLATSAGIFLLGSQTVTLSEPISAQPNGIIVVWSRYTSGAAEDIYWSYQYIPRLSLQQNPAGSRVFETPASTDGSHTGSKVVYVS